MFITNRSDVYRREMDILTLLWYTFYSALIIVVQKSLVTTTTTRRKEQQEMIRKAFQAEEERKRVGRERFPMTTIPVNQLAAYEPAIHHASEEHEEGELQNKRTAVIDRTQHAESPRD